MKQGLEQLIGKTIVAVVANKKRGQVFLVFSGGTSFEFYGWPKEHFNWARGIDREGLEDILKHIRANGDEDASAVFK